MGCCIGNIDSLHLVRFIREFFTGADQNQREYIGRYPVSGSAISYYLCL